MNDNPVLISFAELKTRYGLTSLSRTTIWRMARDGRLPPPIKMHDCRGGRLFWRKEDLDAAIAKLVTDASTRTAGAV
jgi:predicted DNA-binding transcriptional regulator AlpA